MATMTFNAAANAVPATGAPTATATAKQGFLARLVLAIQESRMRRAEIEMRRVRALLADNDTGFQHALLPFKGE